MDLNVNNLEVDINGVHLDAPGPQPSSGGYFGDFGGRFVGETLISALDDISETLKDAGMILVFVQNLRNY